MAQVKLTDRVSIDNLRNWNLDFRATEANRDISIPASVKGYKQLTVAEIDGQVKMGNLFFVGKDGLGNNADIKINDPAVVKFVFGEGTDDEVPSETLLTLDSMKELLKTSPKAKFEEGLNKLVTTEAEKKTVIELAKEAGIEEVEGYKKTAIEKISGFRFE